MVKNNPKVLFLDFETTGAEFKNAQVVSMYIKLVQGKNILGEFNTLVNPGCAIPNTFIHGITDEMVANEQPISFYSDAIVNMFSQADIVIGYNIAKYDLPLIAYRLFENESFHPVNFFLKACKAKFIVFDLFNYVKSKLPLETGQRSLSKVYEHVTGKVLEGAHGAKADVDACIEIIKKLRLTKANLYEFGTAPSVMSKYRHSADEPIVFNFGKYLGRTFTVRELMAFDESYLKFCVQKDIINVDLPAELLSKLNIQCVA